MKTLYISSLCSNKKYNEIFKLSNGNVKPSINKFHFGIIKGLKENGYDDITVLSGLPINNKTTKKLWLKYEKDNEDTVVYKSLPFINLPIIKQLFIIFSLIILIITWSIKNRKTKEKIIITDASYVTVNFFVVIMKKLLNLKTITIVADVYDYMSLKVEKNKKRDLLKKFLCRTTNYCFKNYDGFVFLTKQMNKLLNIKNKPYVIMEGILNTDAYLNTKTIKPTNKNIVYTGSFNSKFGIKELVDDFIKIKDKNIELHLYGHGDLEKYLIEKSKKDSRIKIFKPVSQKEIIKIQQQAYILINPRSNEGEYTKYSFPSKTMEYLASGRPVLMYKLPGVGEEYYNYVYEIKKGIKSSLEDLLKKSDSELNERGKLGKDFVIKNKNTKSQTKKILDLIKTIFTIDNNKKIKPNSKALNIYLSFLLIIYIFLSRNTLYSTLDFGIRKALIIQVFVSLPMIIIYLIRIIKNNINKRNLLIFGIFIILLLFSIIVKKEFEFLYLSLLVYLILAFIFSQLIEFKYFCKTFVKIVIYLCITSLICEYVILQGIIKLNLFDFFEKSVLFVENSVGTPFLKLGVSYVVYSDHYIRNFSIFTEPAYFQFYLIFALIIVFFLQKGKYKNYKIALILIAILSTFSTSAFLSLIFIIPFFFYEIYNVRYAIWGLIRYGLPLIFILLYCLYKNSNMFKYYLDGAVSKLFTNNESISTRNKSFNITLTKFLESPIIGNSVAYFDQYNICNTLPAFFATYGIFPGLFFIYYILKCSFRFDTRKFAYLAVFIMILVSSNLHTFNYVLSFWILIFCGIMKKEEVK